ncbi:MAG: ATP-binding protein, partial [Clostridia bacterium]|nr:ATP-binding protein [Clostridia bacterium]
MAINILDTVIANRISAGEVVEKPASIVKELLDNALDAGATEVKVEIENGGIDFISIRDNGSGIHPDDIKKAFLPHATSKIRCLEDLDNIATLGFRGEALA